MCPPTMHALHSTSTGCIAGRARECVMKAAQNNAAAKAAPPGPTQPSRWRRHMTTPTHLGKNPSAASAARARRPQPRPPPLRPRVRRRSALAVHGHASPGRALTNTMRIGCTCLPLGRSSSGQVEPHKLRCCPHYIRSSSSLCPSRPRCIHKGLPYMCSSMLCFLATHRLMFALCHLYVECILYEPKIMPFVRASSYNYLGLNNL